MITICVLLAGQFVSLSCYYRYTNVLSTLCSEKNTHSHFLPYLQEWYVDLNETCSEYTLGMVDSDHVDIRYSLQLMTSL